MFSQMCVKNSVHKGGVHPPDRHPPPHQTATAADGTHPTPSHLQIDHRGVYNFWERGVGYFLHMYGITNEILHSGILLNNILKFPFSNGFKESPCEHVEPLQAPRVYLQLLHKVANVGKETVCKTETFSIFT